MNKTLAGVITPIAVWGLQMACPLVPAIVWQALVGAVLSNQISLQDILAFMAQHNITLTEQFPQGKNGLGTRNT